MISRGEVRHIAKLARLGITEKEEEKFQRELSKILDYIEQLKEVDISNVLPTSHSISVENVMRKDEIKQQDLEVNKRILEQAPDKKEKHIRVKSIL
jgi:aspartyl-tRNA(Asn)/glutamyl-tRNA(Gln) amidotransferase subunit C